MYLLAERINGIKDITKKYSSFSGRGVGTITAEKGYYDSKNDHTNEIENARRLLSEFGGNIHLVLENNNNKVPDYIWDDLKWELKTPIGCGARTISNQLNSAKYQIMGNPGGLIIDCRKMSFSDTEIVNSVSLEMNRKGFEGFVIIRLKKNKFVVLERIKK